MARAGKYAGIHLATAEDLARDFSDGFAFGFSVRPPEIAVKPEPPSPSAEENG
jgi:hypothetical protein